MKTFCEQTPFRDCYSHSCRMTRRMRTWYDGEEPEICPHCRVSYDTSFKQYKAERRAQGVIFVDPEQC